MSLMYKKDNKHSLKCTNDLKYYCSYPLIYSMLTVKCEKQHNNCTITNHDSIL